MSNAIVVVFFTCWSAIWDGTQGAPHPAVNISQQRTVLHSRPARQNWFLLRMKLDLILKAKSPHWFFDDIFCIYLHHFRGCQQMAPPPKQSWKAEFLSTEQFTTSQLSRPAPDLKMLKSCNRETALRSYINLNFWSSKLLLEIIRVLLGPLLPKFLNTGLIKCGRSNTTLY